MNVEVVPKMHLDGAGVPEAEDPYSGEAWALRYWCIFAGQVLADRYSRRALMIAGDVISAVCVGILISLFLTGQVTPWHVYVMMFIRSVTQTFQSPAVAASTTMLVPKSFLSRAVGFNQAVSGIVIVAAAPMGALAMAILPIGWALSIDVITAVLGVVPLLLFSVPQPQKSLGGRQSIWEDFVEGFSFVWSMPGLRLFFGLHACVVVAIMPAFTLVPMLVKEHFGLGANELAMIEGLGSIGIIVGGLMVAAMAPKRLMLWILLGMAASCLSLALVALAPPNMFWLGIIFWIASSITLIMGEAPLITLIQAIVPSNLQGRILSLLSTTLGVAAPIGLMLAAPLAELIGVRWSFVVIGIAGCCICLSGLFSRRLHRLGEQVR